MATPYRIRQYDPAQDWARVRDFLSATYLASDGPLNWGIERWNWSRYHPMMFDGDVAANVRLWEGAVALWETETSEIAGAAHVEEPHLGDAYLQRHPAHPGLLEEMLDYAEGALRDPATGSLRRRAGRGVRLLVRRLVRRAEPHRLFRARLHEHALSPARLWARGGSRIRRLAALGATRARVGSGQAFYQAVGFRKIAVGHEWTSPSR